MLKKIKNPITIVFKFFKDIVAELKQVEYLSRSKTIRYTVFILVSLLFGSIFLIVVDQFMVLVRNTILQI